MSPTRVIRRRSERSEERDTDNEEILIYSAIHAESWMVSWAYCTRVYSRQMKHAILLFLLYDQTIRGVAYSCNTVMVEKKWRVGYSSGLMGSEQGVMCYGPLRKVTTNYLCNWVEKREQHAKSNDIASLQFEAISPYITKPAQKMFAALLLSPIALYCQQILPIPVDTSINYLLLGPFLWLVVCSAHNAYFAYEKR